MMMKKKAEIDKNRDLAKVLIVTIFALMLFPLLHTYGMDWILFPFAIFFPGYSFLLAFFPRKKFDLLEKVVLGFSLNVVIVTLISLLQFYTEQGSGINPIFTFSLFNVICVGAAYYQRRQNSGYCAQSTNTFQNIKSNRHLYLHLGLTLLVILFTIYQTYTLKPVTGFTELFLLDPRGKAEDYPVNVTVGENVTVLVSVTNREHVTTSYILITKFANNTIFIDRFTINDQEVWSKIYTFSPTTTGDNQKLEFLLYKERIADTPYQETHLWINVRRANNEMG